VQNKKAALHLSLRSSPQVFPEHCLPQAAPRSPESRPRNGWMHLTRQGATRLAIQLSLSPPFGRDGAIYEQYYLGTDASCHNDDDEDWAPSVSER
jgi:hypothetical protein